MIYFYLIVACIPGFTWNSTGITVSGTTGVQGSNLSLLTYTNDVAIDIYANIYVADTNNQRIQRFSSNSFIAQTVVGTTGVTGPGSNQLNYPRSIFVLGDVLYVSDVYNYRIQRYSYNAASGTVVAGGNLSFHIMYTIQFFSAGFKLLRFGFFS